jgi:hypothetical protein
MKIFDFQQQVSVSAVAAKLLAVRTVTCGKKA